MPFNIKCNDPSYRTQTHFSNFPTIISINTHSSATKNSYILSTCGRSYLTRTHLILTPGTCRPHPTRHTTILCSRRLCSIPGTYATKYLPVLCHTNTYFLFTVFGYFGFLITVFSATHLANGLLSSALRGGRISLAEPIYSPFYPAVSVHLRTQSPVETLDRKQAQGPLNPV